MIPILYCGNDRIFEGVFLSAVSVARRTEEALELRILTMDDSAANPKYLPITKEHVETLDRALKRFHPESRAVRVDLTKEFVDAFDGGKNLKNSYTPYALLRLLADDPAVVPYDKAIYLDIDTMACRNIRELWDVDVSAYEYGAALDYMGTFWVAKDYCNSGVLLLNLAKIRETGMFRACRKLIREKWFAMPDQSAIHRSATARYTLERRFNEQRGITPETVIKHFNKGIVWFPFHIYNIKQWQRDAVHKRLKIHDFDTDYAFYDEFMKEDADRAPAEAVPAARA